MAKSSKKPLEVLLRLSEKTSEKLFLFSLLFGGEKQQKPPEVLLQLLEKTSETLFLFYCVKVEMGL